MLDVLREHLLEKPELYLEEMAVFLWDEFDVLVSPSSISGALRSINWLKKTARRVAKERNTNLRDLYLHILSPFCSYHLVYVDESGCHKPIGFRKIGWSPPEGAGRLQPHGGLSACESIHCQRRFTANC